MGLHRNLRHRRESGKESVSAAAVFGQVRDAEGYSCLSTALDATQKTGIASLGAVPQGSSRVSFVVAIQGRSPRPLSLAGFKASYRNAAIESTFKPFDPCEIDSSACEDDEEQPENAKKTISQTGLFGRSIDRGSERDAFRTSDMGPAPTAMPTAMPAYLAMSARSTLGSSRYAPAGARDMAGPHHRALLL